MTAKTKPEIIDQAIILYESGDPLRVCGEKVGVNEETLRNHFKKRGVKMRITSQGQPNPKTITNLPENSICVAYTHGKSENHIANEYGVSRNVIRRILKKHNVHIRTQSEAEELKWSKMTNEQRESQVVKAHSAVRGRIRSDEELNKMAMSREQNYAEWLVGIGEPELKQWFQDRDISINYQKACLSYNLDFLVNNVDLEITGHIGRNKPTNLFIFERSRRIYEQGYKTLYVEFYGVDRLIDNAELIMSTIQEINGVMHGDAHYLLLRLYEDHHSLSVMA